MRTANEVLKSASFLNSAKSIGPSSGEPLGLSTAFDERVQRVIDLIRTADHSKRILESDLARSVGLSVSRFAHLFREETGMTPHQMLSAIRLQQAAALLEETQYAVKEVSWRVGFQTSASFSRLFKRAWGMTPQEYRNARRRTAAYGGFGRGASLSEPGARTLGVEIAKSDSK